MSRKVMIAMAMVKDPVCGKQLDTDVVDGKVAQTRFGAPEIDPSKGTKRFHEGKWYYFCSLACRGKFLANPGGYISR